MTQKTIDALVEALERVITTGLDQYTYEQVMSRPEHYINTALAMARAEPQAKALTDDAIDILWGEQQLTIPQKVQRRLIARAAITEFCKLNGITPSAEGGV